MRIAICGSMTFAREMQDVKRLLESRGHQCVVPEGIERYAGGKIQAVGGSEGASRKVAHDLIRRYYREIVNADAILVCNYSKGGVAHYIGGNAFLEVGFAHVLGKKIFLLHPLPAQELIREELEAMQPQVLHGNLSALPAE